MLPVGVRPHHTQKQALAWVALLRHMQIMALSKTPGAGSAVLTEHPPFFRVRVLLGEAELQRHCPPWRLGACRPCRCFLPWVALAAFWGGTKGLWIFVLFCLNQHL